MNENELYDSLISNSYSTYLLYGEENYQIEKALKVAKDSLAPSFSDLNYTVIDTDYEKNLEDIISRCESVPFMDKKRVVVVKTSDLFSSSSAYDKDEIDNLIEYTNAPLKTTQLIFVPAVIDKRNGFYKKISKNSEVFESKRLDKVQLSNFITGKLNAKHVKIDNSSKDYLIEKSGYLFRDSEVTLFDVENEIEKIVLNTKNDGLINVADIKSTVFEEKNVDIFKFIDAVFNGDVMKSYELLNNITEVHNASIQILALIGRQISLLIKLRILLKGHIPESVIAKKLNLHPFIVKKTKALLNKYTYKELLDLYNICSDMDYRAKTGRINDKISVEIMVGRICSYVIN